MNNDINLINNLENNIENIKNKESLSFKNNEALPSEMLVQIFSYLTRAELKTTYDVCKFWNDSTREVILAEDFRPIKNFISFVNENLDEEKHREFIQELSSLEENFF